MPLSENIITLIRDEIGNDLDFANNTSDLTADQYDSLENIYTDVNRGNSNILVTALIVWRRRLYNMQARSFDVTKEGAWLARSQRIRFLKQQVDHYQRLVGDRPRSRVAKIRSESEVLEDNELYYD